MSFEINYGNFNNFDLYKKGKKEEEGKTTDLDGNGKANTSDWRQGLDGKEGCSLEDLVIISTAVKNFDSLSEEDKKNLDMNGDGKVDAKDKKLLEEQKELIRQMVAQQKTDDISDINQDGKIDSNDWEEYENLKKALEEAEGGELSKKMQSTLDSVEKKLSNKLFDQNGNGILNATDLAQLEFQIKAAYGYGVDGLYLLGQGDPVYGKLSDAEVLEKFDIDGDGALTRGDIREMQSRANALKMKLGITDDDKNYQEALNTVENQAKKEFNNKINSQIQSLRNKREKLTKEKNYIQSHIGAAYAKGKKPSSNLVDQLNAYNAQIAELSGQIEDLKSKLKK